ncbi:MAG: IS4 family transposase [Uliginosibacterium sp.]|nr:IS4 family transposase [Uliginosibacterium sp.]
MECATHAILDAHIGAYRTSEWDICEPLLNTLRPGMLCLADRGFNGYGYWQRARQSGAGLLWRCANNRRLPVIQALSDGSFLSEIYPNPKASKTKEGGIVVRVVEYALPGADGQSVRYRLMSSLLDPDQAPAVELAALYHTRWQVETVFDELKTHLQQRRRVLRSKTPELVRRVLRLGAGPLCGALADAPVASEYRLSHAQLSFTARSTHAPRPAPLRGLSPRATKKTKAMVS